MIKFLKHIALFLVFPLFVIILSDTYLRNKNTLYSEKYNTAIDDADKIEILILGNSHANYGVDPNAFNNYAFNLANVNQSLYFDKRITLKLLPKFKKLKYVLISVDYHSLFFSSQGIRDFWSYQAHHIKYKNEEYILKRFSPTLFGFPPKVTVSYLKRDIINILKYHGNAIWIPVQRGVDLNDSINKGYIGYSNSDLASFNKNKYLSRATSFNLTINQNKQQKSEIIGDLTDFIVKLKQNGITPILYSPPTYYEYNSYLNASHIKDNNSNFNKISKDYDIPYWNFTNMERFSKNYYYDEDHLNKSGAYMLAKILNDSIQNLNYIK